ncbi:uncharacterized protein LOC132630637 [Lycium barbarum]|uniref:uncharacterized protein LOC132630637 n=1 Tax=Lycium barbarum TaxID=112863 RepID=UPI00293E9BFE|nr:uncharacterized protein LOC132630637 [Lycium barbarum]
MHKWGLPGDLHCPLCMIHNESRDHLFVFYDFGKQLWTRLQHWMQSQPMHACTWDQHLTQVIKCAKGKTQRAQIFKMVYTEFVHCLWIERNMRIFKNASRDHATNVSRDHATIAREIAYVCCVRAPPRISTVMASFLF